MFFFYFLVQISSSTVWLTTASANHDPSEYWEFYALCVRLVLHIWALDTVIVFMYMYVLHSLLIPVIALHVVTLLSSWPAGGIPVGNMLMGEEEMDGGAAAAALPKEAKPTFLLLPSQKKLPTFSGLAEGKLEDWISDMLSAIEARPLSEEERVNFVYQHLSGPAKDEIRYRGRESVCIIFSTLRDVFGVRGSSVQLQRAFFDRRQKEGEKLRDFSHSLLDLFERAKRKSPHLMENKEHLLNHQFAEGVSDGILRKHLKKSIREDPDIDLFTLRSEAIEWAEESSLPVETQPQVAVEAAHAKSDTAMMLEILQKQQKQIDELTKTVRELQASKNSRPRSRASVPKCSFCHRDGHVTDKCYQLQLKKAEDMIAELRKSSRPSETTRGN